MHGENFAFIFYRSQKKSLFYFAVFIIKGKIIGKCINISSPLVITVYSFYVELRYF